LCSILTEFGVPIQPVRPINICLRETYSIVLIVKHRRYHEEKQTLEVNAEKSKYILLSRHENVR
jgi:hypothetical protein